MIKFEYNGRIYAPENFEKKLKKLGITKDDVTIIEDTEETWKENQKKLQEGETYHQANKIPLYIFKNKKTNYSITTIYSDLSHMGLNDVSDWVQVGCTYDKNTDTYKRINEIKVD